MSNLIGHPTFSAPAFLPGDISSRPTPPSILEGESPRLFERIHEPGTDLVIWKRNLPEALQCWLAGLSADTLPNWRALVPCDELGPTIESLFHSSATPAGAECSVLAKDITTLAMLFAAVMDVAEVDLRLEAIGHDACWKFHRDCVPARLVTTYRGPGTEWVYPTDSEGALASQRSYTGPVNRLPEHAVALYKGSCTHPPKGIVHRSPTIAGTGTVRLFLCINAPSTRHG